MKLIKIYVDEIPPCCGDCIYAGGYFNNWYLESRCALILTEVPDWDIPQAKLEIDEMYEKRLPECPLKLAENTTKTKEPKCYICGGKAIGGCIDMMRIPNEQSGYYEFKPIPNSIRSYCLKHISSSKTFDLDMHEIGGLDEI